MRLYATFSLALLLSACGDATIITGNCRKNSDCATGFYCGRENLCLCIDTSACGSGKFCNKAGFCQDWEGCLADSDCGDTALWACDTTSLTGKGVCKCRSNDACAEGLFCTVKGACEPKRGCMVDQDCGDEDKYLCRINQDTRIGECLCKNDAACQPGEFCNSRNFCQAIQVCDSNDDCPAGRACNLQSGECLCNPEAQTGCARGEVCNASGYCQPRPGCYDNNDCENLAGTYCDTTTKTCVPNDQCVGDMQCPLAEICKLTGTKYQCIDGCNDSADCPLDHYCGPEKRCVPGCQADDVCGFANFCTAGTCQAASTEQAPYCRVCYNSNKGICGNRSNSCLIYPYTGDAFVAADPYKGMRPISSSTEYCAPDCSKSGHCPYGFECRSVITVDRVCRSNQECPGGVPCLKSQEEDTGYCPCTQDNKNPCNFPNACIKGSSICNAQKKCTAPIAGANCTTNADCAYCQSTREACSQNSDCRPITCELYPDQTYGGCVSAKACGLIEGMHCPAE